MKKFLIIKNILTNYRKLGNLWVIRQQIVLTQIAIDLIESQIREIKTSPNASIAESFRQWGFLTKDAKVTEKARELEERKAVLNDTLKVQKGLLANTWRQICGT